MSDSASNDNNVDLISRNARYGLGLFALYVLSYAGFILLAVFPSTSLAVAESLIGKVDIAILYITYGFGLIVAALVLAVIYMILCRRDLQPNKLS